MSKKEKKKRREEQATNRIPRRNSASFKPEYSSKQTLLLIISNLEEALVSVPTGRFSPSLVLGSRRRPNVPPSKNPSPRCLRRFLRFFIEGPSPFFARGSFFPVRSISGNAFGPRPRRPRPVKRGRYARITARF